MSVPKASMDKDRQLQSREHQIRRTWQVAPIQPVPVSQLAGSISYSDFRFCVLAADTTHHLGTDGRGDDIHDCSCPDFCKDCKHQAGARQTLLIVLEAVDFYRLVVGRYLKPVAKCAPYVGTRG